MGSMADDHASRPASGAPSGDGSSGEDPDAAAAEARPERSGWWRRSVWARDRSAPLRAFVQTESGSAMVLVAGIVAALVWANVDTASYDSVWNTDFSIKLGRYGISQDLRTWINSGLMALFFLVVGLETVREFDLGDLRERRRFVLPLVAGVEGMLVPIGIYLVINHGRPSAHGWGVAMSTDTALALGVLAVLGRDIPDRMRVFVLTVFVVDDLAALAVIAAAYSGKITVTPLVVAAAAYALLLVAVRLRLPQPAIFVGLGILMSACSCQWHRPHRRRPGDRLGPPRLHPEPRRPPGRHRVGTPVP